MLASIQRLFRRAPAAASGPAPEPQAGGLAEAAELRSRANRCIAEGRWPDAVATYRQALELEPGHATAWSNLGFALRQLERLDEAEAALNRALSLDPAFEEPHLFLGQVAEARGDIPGAMRHLGDAVRCKPGFAFAWQELCRLQFHSGQAALARESALRGLEADPGSVLLNFYLGNVLHHDRDYRGAVMRYQLALRQADDFAQAHLNMGITLMQLQESEAALRSIERALALDTQLDEALFPRAQVLQRLARFDDAVEAYERTLQAFPEHVEALYAFGELCVNRHDFERAELCFERAHALLGDESRHLLVSGNLLRARGELSGAEAAYRQALQLRGDFSDAHNNLGALLVELQRFDEAEASYRDAIAHDQADATARWNLSLVLLRIGRLEQAWPLFEARYDPSLPRPVARLPVLPFLQWRGEALTGKSILMIGEQGYGDEIQMVRYAKLLKQCGASRVSLVCKPPLRDLMATATTVDAVFTDQQPVPAHDFWTLCFSLPGHFGTRPDTIPAPLPYLQADPLLVERWRPNLPPTGRRVGLVWKGAAAHGNDLNRSLPGLSTLAALWTCPGISFVSLQKGQGEDEAALAAQPGHPQALTELGSRIASFADTAAILAQLDLLICVDTSTAHLAGALGRPCWVLLPAIGTDWRWLHERDDSPWYPGVMRLFRQTLGEPWERTVERVADALREWARAPG